MRLRQLIVSCVVALVACSGSESGESGKSGNSGNSGESGESAEPSGETGAATRAQDLETAGVIGGQTPGEKPMDGPRVRIHSTVGGDGLDKEIVHRVTRRYVRRLAVCYQKALASRPDLAGEVSVSFAIGADGRTSDVKASGLGDTDTETCAVEMFRTFQFPPKTDRAVVNASVVLALGP